MTAPLWGRILRQDTRFPSRLDDEYSFLSLCFRLPLSQAAQRKERQEISARITYRREYPHNPFSKSHLALDARIEVFDFPEGISGLRPLGIRNSFLELVRQRTEQVGLALFPPIIVSLGTEYLPDPGDLPGHLVSDLEIKGASIRNLEKASNHKLVDLIGRPDLELLRLP